METNSKSLPLPPPAPHTPSFATELQQRPWSGSYGLGPGDRRFSLSRQHSSSRQLDHLATRPLERSLSLGPLLARSDSSISVPSDACLMMGGGDEERRKGREKDRPLLGRKRKLGVFRMLVSALYGAVRSGNRHMRRLALMILLNAAYSTAELLIGIGTGRVGLVSDAFHLTFGCGLLTFSLLAMALSGGKPDGVYTYGYKRLEVLSAFTNALFLLFMSFSLAVEALHAFIEDESEHKHYLIFSAVTNLLVNLLGVWFFRGYARVNLVYRKAEDMNYHSVCLHVIADSIRSAGIILASWFLSLGVENAEVLCLGLVSVAVFVVVIPLFRASGGILLQKSPSGIPSSAFSKCWRQIATLEDVSEVFQARFWELVPGHVVGSLSIQLRDGADEYTILHYVHGLYHDLGIRELTVQTSYGSTT